MYEEGNVAVWHTWFFVFFWYIIFFPVGIYLTYKKLMLEGEANGNIVGLIVCVIAFFLIPFVAMILRPISFFVFLIFLGLFIYDINKGEQRRQARWNNEEKIVHGQDKISFIDIACNLGYPTKLVEDDFQVKINKGFFPGYYSSNGVLYKKGMTPNRQQGFQAQARPSAPPPVGGRPSQPTVITCSGCGAQNEVNNMGSVFCEYCGKRLR